MNIPQKYQIALVEWQKGDGISLMIEDELTNLGHDVFRFLYNEIVPPKKDVVFSFGPLGSLWPFINQLAQMDNNIRPLIVHWNTEGLPDPRIPLSILKSISRVRTKIGKIRHANITGNNFAKYTFGLLDEYLRRFRYFGDYHYLFHQGLLDVFADSSVIYGEFHKKNELPTLYVPWGSSPRNYAHLGLRRDIDVVWMGKRGSKRRSKLLNRIRQQLLSYGVELYVFDNEERPFIFGEERTNYLNRAKITLNLTRTWYDDNFSRFSFAIPNRSLVVSEPLQGHCPQYKPGFHYISAPIDSLAQTIMYYLNNDHERNIIVENAYQLITSELRFSNGIKKIIKAVDSVWMRKKA